jgi:hypothetical protein
MPSSTIDQLDRVTPEYDRLVADVRLGIPSARALHDLEERAQAIAASIVAAFRRPAPITRAPLVFEQRPDGSASAGW